MDLNAPNPQLIINLDHVRCRASNRAGGLLVYACSRIMLPFTGILVWSAILAVMLYPLHLRLAVRLGNRWSALLIGLVGVAVMLVPMVIVVTSLATSIYSLISGLQSQNLTCRRRRHGSPAPRWSARN